MSPEGIYKGQTNIMIGDVSPCPHTMAYEICMRWMLVNKNSGSDASEKSITENVGPVTDKEVFLKVLLKSIPDMIWMKNVDGVYLACNSMFERFFGAKEADIVGKTDFDFVDRDMAEFFRENDRRSVEAGRPTMNEEDIIFAADGHHARLETIKTPMYTADGTLMGVLGIARDITYRKQMEDALCHSAEMNCVLREIAEAAILAPSLEILFHDVHRLVEKILPAKAFHINIVDEDAGEVIMPFWAESLDIIPHHRPIGKGLTEYVMGLGRTVYLRPTDLDRMRAEKVYSLPQMPRTPVQHYLASPLVNSRNKPIGTMALMLLEESQEFTQEEIEIYSIIAAQVSMAISNRKAIDSMRESEKLFANAFSQAPLGIALISSNGRFLKVNRPLCLLLGCEPEEMLTMSYFPEIEADAAEQRRRLLSGEIESYQGEIRFINKSGQVIWAMVNSSLVRSDTGEPQYVIAHIEDISKRKRMEQELQLHAGKLEETVERRTQELYTANQELTSANQEMAGLNKEMLAMNSSLERLNRSLSDEIEMRKRKEEEVMRRRKQHRAMTSLLTLPGEDYDTLLKKILEAAVELIGAPGGEIARLDDSGKSLAFTYAVGFRSGMERGVRTTDTGMVGQVCRSGEVLYVEDYRQYPQRVNKPWHDSLTTIIMAPLKLSGRVKGFLTAEWCDEVHPITPEDIEDFHQFGNLASIVMERVRARDQITYRNQLLQKLTETTLSLVNELDLKKALQNILDQATTFIGVPHGFIQMYESDGRRAGIKCGVGRYEPLTGSCMQFDGKGICAEVLRTGKPVFINDYQNWEDRLVNDFTCGMTSAMQVPLNIEGKTVGSVGLAAFAEKIIMDEEKMAVFEQFAAVAAIAIKNALYHQQTNHLALHDTLTGLPNRAYLNRHLEEEMERARRGQSAGAVMFIDLDDLKTVNDHFGHTSGDSVIIASGNDIVSAAGDNAFVARVGGDEFVIILPGTDNEELIAPVADRLVGAIRREYEVRGKRIHMSTSIGVTLYPEDGVIAEEILKNADIAMYAAKAAGKNCWRFYEHGMQQEDYEKMVLTNSLRHALENEELYLLYQPLIALDRKTVVGFEALLRWSSREHGMISPARFIPLAEQSGLILSIGKWVFAEACRFARNLADMGNENIRVSVNVSPCQLATEDFSEMVRNSIEEANIRSQQIEVEITENVLIESLEESTRKLAELSALGVQLSLDDFGTGFSSLTYLRNLPVTTLKIDKSFINEMLRDKVQEGFIRSIIDMAHVLSLNVVAEGVETEPQLSKLVQFGCDCVQGYVYSRPISQEDAIRFLHTPIIPAKERF